jgi:multidrug efflux pump subunit AcrB
MSLITTSVKNPVLVNILMVIVFVVGIFTIYQIPKEEAPNIEFGKFIITINYVGVSPSDIEKSIVMKVEEELFDLENISKITSVSKEGYAKITLEMEENADLDKTENTINRRINSITDLPKDASEIQVQRLNMAETNPMGKVIFSGDFSETASSQIAEDLKSRIRSVPFISKVDAIGVSDREILVSLNTHKLNHYNIPVSEISELISNKNKNVPIGNTFIDQDEFIIRSAGEFDSVQDLENTIIKMTSNGAHLKLKDVATIKDTVKERNVLNRYNKEKSVTLTLYKKQGGNIIHVMDDVKRVIAKYQKQHPNVKLIVKDEDIILLQKSIRHLGNNALSGIILVFIVLLFFVGWRSALLATWGLPFSFLLTFIVMNFVGISINQMSLFGLILIMGMLVDDSIVVIENVQRKLEQGLPILEATIQGIKQISLPVTASVMTTISAFFPILFLKGMIGKYLWTLPFVVIIALLASLIECLFILPAHIVELGESKKPKKKTLSLRINDFLAIRYKVVLAWILDHRLISSLSIIGLFVFSIMLVATGQIKMNFLPKDKEKGITLNVTLPNGNTLEQTTKEVAKIEEFILNMPEKIDINSVSSNIGQLQGELETEYQTNFAEIKIEFIDVDEMQYTAQEIKNPINKFCETLPNISSAKFRYSSGGVAPSGKDLEMRFLGKDALKMQAINKNAIAYLSSIKGLDNIQSSLASGKNEIKILFNYPLLKFYGISVKEVNSILRTAVYGSKISTLKGTSLDEIDIVLKSQNEDIKDFANLKNLKVKTSSGKYIALDQICEFKETIGNAQIEHYNRERVFTISASIDKESGLTTSELNKLVEKKYQNFSLNNPGYRLELGGIAEEERKTYGSLIILFITALLMVYAILGTQFKSYIQPFVVMTAIPFGIIGVLIGLWITGLPISLMAMIAFVALSGIVVNDSLILVDFINKLRLEGKDLREAIIEAGAIRLRPILMTTITTIAGFFPLILSQSYATVYWRPMAVAIAFGLGFATILTLCLIPVIYSFTESIKMFFKKKE